MFWILYSLGVPHHDETSLGGKTHSRGFLKPFFFRFAWGKVCFCFLFSSHSTGKFRCFLRGICCIVHGNRVYNGVQNKKLNIKRLMKSFSHDYSLHDQSGHEMVFLQLNIPTHCYLSRLLYCSSRLQLII